ncbi:hypothetical protein ACVIGB_000545 [Bradyrhizobium sp. USDA 4341]
MKDIVFRWHDLSSTVRQEISAECGIPQSTLSKYAWAMCAVPAAEANSKSEQPKLVIFAVGAETTGSAPTLLGEMRP